MIVQATEEGGRLDLVLLLDEVDKVGTSNFHGDPAAAAFGSFGFLSRIFAF